MLLRKCTVAWGSAKVEEFFLRKMNANGGPTNNVKDGLKDLMRFGGGKINSLTEFTAWVKLGTLDCKMRAVIKYGMYNIWGSDNLWAIDIEKEFTRMLGITWLPHCADGLMQQRISKGRCAAHLFVKCKGSLVGTIRNAQKSAHSSSLLVREPKKKMGGDAATAVTKGKVMKKIPREVVHCDSATVHCDSATTVAQAPATYVVPATNEVVRATNVVPVVAPVTHVVPIVLPPSVVAPIQVLVLESTSTPSSSLTTPNSAQLQAETDKAELHAEIIKLRSMLEDMKEVSQLFLCILY
jgi:hypothetical protein